MERCDSLSTLDETSPYQSPVDCTLLVASKPTNEWDGYHARNEDLPQEFLSWWHYPHFPEYYAARAPPDEASDRHSTEQKRYRRTYEHSLSSKHLSTLHTQRDHKKINPIIGSLVGIIPQCGVSVVASDLYLKRHITIGTLTAVFFACSDEALPILFTDSSKNRLLDIIYENITNKSSLTYHEKIIRKCLNFLVDAPVIILVYSEKDDLTNNDILSIGSSIEHICLSATNINIGSLWLGAIVDLDEVISKEFNIDMKLVSALALGYSDEVAPNISRKNIEEILSFK